ncbi:MAG: glycosyltransferase family 2 protein [Ruminococcus sp.]
MLSYNTAQYITGSIQSVIDQTYHNWELIIVDDCSTDNTDIVIGKIKDPRIRYIKNEKNSGAAVSVGIGRLRELLMEDGLRFWIRMIERKPGKS